MGFFSAVKKFFSGSDAPQVKLSGGEITQEAPAENNIMERVAADEISKSLPEMEKKTGSAPSTETCAEDVQAASESAAVMDAPSQDDETVSSPVEGNSAVDSPIFAEEANFMHADVAGEKSYGNQAVEEVEQIYSIDAAKDNSPGENMELAPEYAQMLVQLRQAPPRLSNWLEIILSGVNKPDALLWERLEFLLRSLDAPPDEIQNFIADFKKWLERMEYAHIDEFRSELQYKLALALDLEDEEDERSRLFVKLSDGLARTRAQLAGRLDSLFAGKGELDENFWEELEELFIMADLGYEPSLELVKRLRQRAREGKIASREEIRGLLHKEIEDIFYVPKKISAVNPPEIVLMVGVNGVGKTTTIAKLAHRAKMQGKKVLIAAGDTFRAAAIEQLEVWARRVGVEFFARPPGTDPAAVAYEAVDVAIKKGLDLVFVDTAGRLQTKTNLMQELGKIRQVLAKKHPGSPHRSILVLDATTGQNALSQAKLFREAAGADELILTKLDGTAKGGVAIAVAMQENLPITYVGLGEKMEDLRPFSGKDYASALLGGKEKAA